MFDLRLAQRNSSQGSHLWPGDAAARALGITRPDSRMLFRLFVNLAIYGKLGVLIALLVF